MLSATYSPEDNKLRLYATGRLDKETYERVRAAGFIWAPQQKLFVAPSWTPEREDLLLDLCGEIGDEDASLVDRAEERAARFSDYSDRRDSEAEAAYAAATRIADGIPLGQPILVGHHSERRARKDIQRIENGMRRAFSLWQTAEYWKYRATCALRAAKYKELPDVRRRRIKRLESERKKAVRNRDKSQRLIEVWTKDGLTLERAKYITNYFDDTYHCFPLSEFPRETSKYEGMTSLWSALDDGIINETQARDIAVSAHKRCIANAERWIEHYSHRLAYEHAMLDEHGSDT